MGSPDSVSATMLLNSLIPAVCFLLVSNSHSLGLQGLKEQKAREGKKQVGLPCKTIVTEAWSTPGRSPHVGHRVSEPRHDDGGVGRGAVLPLAHHHLSSQPRRHHRWRVPHNLYSSLLPRAQKCRG